MEGDTDELPERATAKRACDYCRIKKVRCDRQVPCLNCRLNKTICRTTALAEKGHRRIHISHEYEKKIDGLDNRLINIEDALATIASKLESNSTPAGSVESGSQARTPQSRLFDSLVVPEVQRAVHFEGKTGNNTQSDYVRNLLVQVVGETPSVGQNAEVRAALTALEGMVAQHNHDTALTTSLNQPLLDRSLASVNSATIGQPPWEVVKLVLNKALKTPTIMFANLFSMVKLETLCEIIEDAYFHPETCGTARRIIAYCVLFNLFRWFSIAPWSGTDRKTLTGSHAAKTHLEIAWSQLDMFFPASYENALALNVSTGCAIQMSRPLLAWVLVSNAAELCQNLGYHRFETMKYDTKEDQRFKMHIFWFVCMFEKQLSLRLGRVSRIHDWDVSLPLHAMRETSPNGFEGGNKLIYWVKVAKVQGQIYEKLYSPAAFRKPFEERSRTAAFLVKAMNQAWSERGQEGIVDIKNNLEPNETEVPSRRKTTQPQRSPTALETDEDTQSFSSRIEDIFFHADVVVHYSTCALIQRATSLDNSTYSRECLESSRAALIAHMRSNDQFNTGGKTELWAGYLHWAILQAPLTPFMVLVSNAIQQTDPTDLKPLTDFVTSLESCRAFSVGAEKLYKMCLLFLKVAGFYIQAKVQERQNVQMPAFSGSNQSYTNAENAGGPIDLDTIAQFGPHLSALGFVSDPAWSTAAYAPDLTAQAQGQGFFTPDFELDNALGHDGLGMGYNAGGAGHNSIQDWFAGSRYLNNFMDMEIDLPMPDFSDAGL
ncbi:hypothetical protein ACET3X_009956 [Alternaria dauci]|uniref:Zn(2)-C6 fungal-type domain-containing protein n=1 Tax=Alternaria dauci TaxID=48095 RepID=A0ABR3U7A9_9PLEO